MHTTDPVSMALNGKQNRHIEGGIVRAGRAAELQELLAADPRLVQRHEYFSIMANGKVSWPAGTGVWVVKTVEHALPRSRHRRQAAFAIFAQRSSIKNAAVPRSHGRRLGAARDVQDPNPPIPRTISCKIRFPVTPYSRRRARDPWGFASTSVSQVEGDTPT